MTFVKVGAAAVAENTEVAPTTRFVPAIDCVGRNVSPSEDAKVTVELVNDFAKQLPL